MIFTCDLSNIGGLMQASTELLASAGRNVTSSSPTHTTSFNGRYVNQSGTELASAGTMRVGNTAGANSSGPMPRSSFSSRSLLAFRLRYLLNDSRYLPL